MHNFIESSILCGCHVNHNHDHTTAPPLRGHMGGWRQDPKAARVPVGPSAWLYGSGASLCSSSWQHCSQQRKTGRS